MHTNMVQLAYYKKLHKKIKLNVIDNNRKCSLIYDGAILKSINALKDSPPDDFIALYS